MVAAFIILTDLCRPAQRFGRLNLVTGILVCIPGDKDILKCIKRLLARLKKLGHSITNCQ